MLFSQLYSDGYGEPGSSAEARYDQGTQFESPPTPGGNRRITRSKARGGAAPPPPVRQHIVVEPPRKRKPGRKPHVDAPSEDETSLYNIIRNCKTSMTVSLKYDCFNLCIKICC